MEATEATRYAKLSDEQLAQAIGGIERELDRIGDATWPGAFLRRQELFGALAAAEAEQERRRV